MGTERRTKFPFQASPHHAAHCSKHKSHHVCYYTSVFQPPPQSHTSALAVPKHCPIYKHHRCQHATLWPQTPTLSFQRQWTLTGLFFNSPRTSIPHTMTFPEFLRPLRFSLPLLFCLESLPFRFLLRVTCHFLNDPISFSLSTTFAWQNSGLDAGNRVPSLCDIRAAKYQQRKNSQVSICHGVSPLNLLFHF